MSISTAYYSNIASKASVSHHFLCVQCDRLAIMTMAGRNRTPPPPNFEAGYGPAVRRKRVKICAECGKGFRIGTNEVYNIKIKIKVGARVGDNSKIFCFCSYVNMAASDKGILLNRKLLKKFLLNQA